MKKLIFVVMLLGTATNAVARQHIPDKTNRHPARLEKGAGSPSYAILNIGDLAAWVRSDGINFSPSSDNSVYFPRGTANVVYKDGFLWGAKAYLDPAHTMPPDNGHTVRVGGATYGTGTRAGYVTGLGANAVAVNPNDPEVRIYRIRRDYFTLKNENGAYTSELRRDAADMNEIPPTEVSDAQMETVYWQYQTDWIEWPVQYGAPYIERNGIPGYQSPPSFNATFTVDSLIAGNYDEPGISGPSGMTPADQVLWTVYNDLNESAALSFASSEPLGLEIQKTQWGYKSATNIADMYFVRFRIINKGGVKVSSSGTLGAFFLDSMYVCQWSDPDLGSFSDDLVGCDTTMDLGFVYNGNDVDVSFRNFDLSPPSVGYRLLQGPVVLSLDDTATFEMKHLPGKKNLAMTSFTYFSAGSAFDSPLPTTYSYLTGTWWKLLRGYYASFYFPIVNLDSPDEYFPHGPFTETKFPLSGNPVSRNGFIDGLGRDYSFSPGDRRLLVNSGPFTMAPGDTQEVIYSLVAGLGNDRFSSISVMKANAKIAGALARRSFEIPGPPATPQVTVTALNQEVILDWGSDHAAVKKTEQTSIGGFQFEGYNIYQLPAANAERSDGKKIATFDIVNDVTTIIDYSFDSPTGGPVPVVVQQGTNSGIQHSISIKQDYLSSAFRAHLRNGQEYYFAVTAYNYSRDPEALPRSYESESIVLSIKPQIPFGLLPSSKYGDAVPIQRIQGSSDGTAVASVVDPLATTGDTYEIHFGGPDTAMIWYVQDMTKNRVVADNLTDQKVGSPGIVVDGLLLRVTSPMRGFKDFLETFDASGLLIQPHYAGFGFQGFPSAQSLDRPFPDAGGGAWGIHVGLTDSVADFKTFEDTVTASGANWLSISDHEFEMRFTPAGGKALSGTNLIDVPFELWDGMLEDSLGYHLRLIPVIADVNGNGIFDLNGMDHPVSTGDNDPETDWFSWYRPRDVSAGQSGYDAWVASGGTAALGAQVFSRMVLVNYNGGSVSDPTFPANVTATMPQNGTVFLILTSKPNSPQDVFQFTAPTVASSFTVQKAGAQRVGVFPNPYYAGRDQETTAWRHFVTFNNLPPHVTIRIFNLAGHLVRTLEKNEPSQFLEWDLTNKDNWQVASGMYICYVEMPDIGETKVLKLAVIQPQIFSPY